MFLKQIISATMRTCRHDKQIGDFVQKTQNCRRFRTLASLQRRNLHQRNDLKTSSFYQTENNFIFCVINKGSVPDTPLFSDNIDIQDQATFNTFLNKDWRLSNATEILKAFKGVKQYCVDNNVNVGDPQFGSLVDGLVDHCDKLTDNELLELLTVLSYFPVCPAYTSRNFHDTWSCLDDICCWRMQTWDIDTLFSFADAWYKLNMGKICNFVFKVLDRLPKKATTLTKDQLVRIFFYFNVCRRRPVDFEYEAALEHKIKEMSVDEMGVVALGYFKSQSKIKIQGIQQAMIGEVTRKSMGVHEITLTAIVKTLRFSHPTKLVGDINKMLDALCAELDRLSELCCLHVALISTGLHTYHKNTLRKCTEKIVQVLPNTRLKDIERILNVLTMFDFDPKTSPDIFQAAFEELHKDSRISEMNRYPRCLPCALNYLSLRGIYSFELMNRVLDLDFITINYGAQAKYLPRELLSLDACIDVECPGYKGNRLPPQLKYRAVKWLTEFTPSYHQWQRLSAIDKLTLDTIDTVKEMVGNEEFLFVQHVLPHFLRADIIICQDTRTGQFVKPVGFERYILGDVMTPFQDKHLKWYAIILLGWNNTIRDTSLPLGHCIMKERQLRKIGYHPIEVIWNQFSWLSAEEKLQYVKQKLD